MDSLDTLFALIAAVLGFAGLVVARSARRMARERLEKAELRLTVLEQANRVQRTELSALREQLAAGSIALGKAGTVPSAEVLGDATSSPAQIVGTPTIASAAPIEGAASSAALDPAAVLDPSSSAVPIAGLVAMAELVTPGSIPAADASASAARAASPESTSLEEKIALVWFTRIGALALLVGVAFFFKYAVDNAWIGPLGRVALGALVGLGVIVAAEIARAQTKAVFLQVLLGVGLAFLFVSAYASFALYQLVPMPVAFGAIVVFTLLGGALSIRHRGEGVLVLSLLAGFACPILLSSHQDKPAALFAYLLVLTALGFATSVRMGFRYATWLGMAGSAVLFGGWYASYFDPHAPVRLDLEDGEQHFGPAGAYFALSTRAVPLGALALFLIEWLFVQASARRSAFKAQLQPLAFLVVALLLGHVGVTALLYDHEVLLGLAMAGLALLSSLLLGRESRRELLAVPLVASFLALLACAHGSSERPGGMLAVVGLVGVIYAAGVLRDQLGAARKPDARSVQLLCGVGVLLALVSAALLLPASPDVFAFVLAALSLAFAAFAFAFGFGAIAAGAAALSFAGLLSSEPQPGPKSALFLGAAALWAAVYFATTAYDLLARRAVPTAARLFTLSAAGLGFAALLMVHSHPADWLLRSGLLALLGALDLAVGAALLRRAQRQAATVLLGQALALFAGAAALLFSGATVTLVWAALAAVVAVLAASEEDPQWLAGAGVLSLLAISRALFVDFELPEQQRELFLSTFGAQGSLRETFLLNSRALALASTAAALLVSARALSRRAPALFQRAAFACALLGHALLVTLCVCEAQDLYLATPTPGSIPFTSESGFAQLFFTALAAQQEALSVITTVVMSIYAALLVIAGFLTRSRSHRFFGLGLFALALGKLVLWDVWHLRRIEQMVVLVAMGALLLGSSFLYARFGKRLVTLLRDGELPAPKPGTAALLILLGAALLGGGARAADPSEFLRFRMIGGVPTPGLYRVEIDPPLYAASLSTMVDLRVAGPDGAEEPWLLRDVVSPQRLIRHDAAVVDPVTLPDGSTRAVLDLGSQGLKHSEVELEISGSDFLRRTLVESSADEISFAKLSDGALVYRVSSGDSSSAGMLVDYPVSDARYLRVTLRPGADGQALRITGAHLAYTTEETKPPQRTLDFPVSALEHKPGFPSRFSIDLGQEGLPIDSLRLEIATPLFERQAVIKSSRDGKEWSSAGAGLLYRGPGAEGLVLRFAATRARYLRVDITDGDNPPLAVSMAHASYRPQELVFSAAAPGAHKLFVGAPNVGMPSYDLAAVVARSGDALAIQSGIFGPLIDNPAWRAPAGTQAATPLSEKYKPLIVSLLGALLLALAIWTVRLLRKDPSA